MGFSYAAFTVMMPDYTVEESAALLKELGYQGIEWRVHSVASNTVGVTDYWRGNKATFDVHTIVEKAPYIRKLAEDNGLENIALGTYLSYKHLDDVKRCMEAAVIMGCRDIRVSPPNYTGKVNYNDLYEEAVDGYHKIEDLAKQYKVRANIELHPGSICCSAGLGYRFVSNFDPDWVGVILDPGNMVAEGYENWQMGLELLGPYLSYVHVKNTAWVRLDTHNHETRWRNVASSMRDGFVPWRLVMTALDKVGYKGWLALEDFAPGETRAKLADDIDYLKCLESALGL